MRMLALIGIALLGLTCTAGNTAGIAFNAITATLSAIGPDAIIVGLIGVGIVTLLARVTNQPE